MTSQWIIPLLMLTSMSMAGDTATVENSTIPKGQAYTFQFDEDMRIGPDRGDNYIWDGTMTSVQVDGRGHMFLVDVKENHVIELDQQGKEVRIIGGQGMGPNEFQRLTTFQVFDDGTRIAFQNLGTSSKFTWFDAEGEVTDSKTISGTGKIFASVQFSPNRKLASGMYITIDPVNRLMNFHSVIMNDQLEPLLELSTYNTSLPDPSKAGDPNFWEGFLADQMKAAAKGLFGFANFDKDSNVYTAVSNTYKLTRYSPDLEKNLVFSRKYKPIPQTEEQIQAVVDPITEMIQANMPPQIKSIFTRTLINKAISKAEFPPAKHPALGLSTTTEGQVLVVHDADMVSRRVLCDIFDQKGHFIGSFSHKLGAAMERPVMVMRDGYGYSLERTDEDDVELIRYRYKLVKATPVN